MSDRKNGANGRKTLVEEGTEFRGSFSSDCPVEVKGRVEGDVAAPSLVVSRTGSVRGRVKVEELHSEGDLAGDFDADMVQLSGTVKDDTVIRAKSLEVKLAAREGKMQVTFGQCELLGDARSSREASVAFSSEGPKRTKATGGPPETGA